MLVGFASRGAVSTAKTKEVSDKGSVSILRQFLWWGEEEVLGAFHDFSENSVACVIVSQSRRP